MDGEKSWEYASNRSEGKLVSIQKCVGPLDVVQRLFFLKLKISPHDVVIRKGWFQNTLPIAKNEIGPITLLRLDGDWYESTKVCLENLYDKVIPGGYIIIDDYGHHEGCKIAVDEFLKNLSFPIELHPIVDSAGRYFQKPKLQE